MMIGLDWREALRVVGEWSYALSVSAAVLLIVLFGVTLAQAHDHWVNAGRYKNTAGEWCCGAYDCKGFNEEAKSTPTGWLLGDELVPYDEALLRNDKAVVPEDGSQLTICRRPDGSRRCVFGRKPGF